MIVYTKWATLSASEVIKTLQSSTTNGLDEASVIKNRKLFGKNTTTEGERSHLLIEIFSGHNV